jgi:hypothetical protein
MAQKKNVRLRSTFAQPRTGKARIPSSARFDADVKKLLVHVSETQQVSQSWIVACALADAFGLEIPYDWRKRGKPNGRT